MSIKDWREAYLGIGSNLGDRNKNIKSAISLLRKKEGVKVVKVSTIIETDPVGGPRQGKFLNGAIKIKTNLSPVSLLRALKDIEKAIGRKKTVRFGPRVIDLDILLYADKRINLKSLQIPHPRMQKREFVMRPLRQIV